MALPFLRVGSVEHHQRAMTAFSGFAVPPEHYQNMPVSLLVQGPFGIRAPATVVPRAIHKRRLYYTSLSAKLKFLFSGMIKC
jgi:hypothetical protein